MRAHRLAIGGLLAAALLGGCGAQNASLVPSSPGSGGPTGSGAGPSLSRPSVTPAATLAMPSDAQASLDPGLLAILPASVGGVPVTQEPESFSEAIKDPAFLASVDRAVFAIAVSGGDLASGVVAHLRQGVYSDQMFADWRSSYDDGACSQAGGVVAHAEESLGGRTTYVTTCGGGLRVFHTYLAGKSVIVSLFSLGAKDFGGQLMAGIQG